MIEMRVGQEHMINGAQLRERQIAHAGAGIHQDVLIQQQRRGARRRADAATGPENADFH